LDIKEQYQVKNSNRHAALESLDDDDGGGGGGCGGDVDNNTA
jgi:hypothetical protein